MALGYILGKGSAKLTRTELNIPLALLLSVIPDIDILADHIDGFASIVPHRGPIHSVVVWLVVFIPFFVVYRKTAFPYFIALIQHILIGDFLTGGQLQLLWPISQLKFGAFSTIEDVQNIGLEIALFAASLILLLATRDFSKLFKPSRSNLLLAIPTFTVLVPTFLSFPLDVPAALILPHLIFMVIFLASIVKEFWMRVRSLGSMTKKTG